VGLIGASPGVQPPNFAPEWVSVPNPSFVVGVGGTYALVGDTFDPEGDTLTFTLNGGSAAWPSGWSMDSAGLITVTVGALAATTTGIIVDIDDGTASPVSSTAFSAIVVSENNILRKWDYSTGDYTQWNTIYTPPDYNPQFSGIPDYGRPVYPADGATRYPGVDSNYFGDGQLMELLPTFQGRSWVNRVTVKNGANWNDVSGPTGDWDGSVSTRRRTELNNHLVHGYTPTGPNGPQDSVMPYLSERWWSISYYIPADWESSGNGFNVVHQLKSPNTNQISPPFSLEIKSNEIGSGYGWKFTNLTNPAIDPGSSDLRIWQWGMFYDGSYPQTGVSPTWDDGVQDFANANSRTNLGVFTKGAWTDFIFHAKFDGRGSDAGGTGFLNMWKRDDGGAWNQILAIVPHQNVRGGETFNHGIGYKLSSNGFGPLTGIYCGTGQVENLANNRVLYNTGLKIADDNATLEEMKPTNEI
jgi:hypothetical protein